MDGRQCWMWTRPTDYLSRVDVVTAPYELKCQRNDASPAPLFERPSDECERCRRANAPMRATTMSSMSQNSLPISYSPVPRSKSKLSRYTPPPQKKAPPSKLWVPVTLTTLLAAGLVVVVT